MSETKKVTINKESLKVENGKVVIDSQDLVNAIEDEGINLYSDRSFLQEEANSATKVAVEVGIDIQI